MGGRQDLKHAQRRKVQFLIQFIIHLILPYFNHLFIPSLFTFLLNPLVLLLLVHSLIHLQAQSFKPLFPLSHIHLFTHICDSSVLNQTPFSLSLYLSLSLSLTPHTISRLSLPSLPPSLSNSHSGSSLSFTFPLLSLSFSSAPLFHSFSLSCSPSLAPLGVEAFGP